MKKIFKLIVIFIVTTYPIILSAKTIKNNIIYLGYDRDKKPLLIVTEITRQDTSIKDKTDTTINIKYLNGNRIVPLYNNNFLSDTPIDRIGFDKNILIRVLEQSQIELGTTGLSFNFNIISLAQKRRATYTRTINNVHYKYYINTAFFGKEGNTLKGSLFFLEAESQSSNFSIPEIVFVTDNLFRSWAALKFSATTMAVVFSEGGDLFRTSDKYSETAKQESFNMEKGLQYNRSILLNIPDMRHKLELNTTSDFEELDTPKKRGGRIYVYSEGYTYTRDGMTSIFGIRIINKQ
jgi:hypothetical protein